MILLADREYIGEKWFKFLKDKGLGFVIRLKKGVYKKYVDQQKAGKSIHFKHPKWGQSGMKREAEKIRYQNVGVCKEVEILGKKYTYLILKNPKENAEEKFVYFLSTLKKKIVKSYPVR
jgi:hypothetical protein